MGLLLIEGMDFVVISMFVSIKNKVINKKTKDFNIMSLLDLPNSPSCAFYIIAISWSLFQAHAGYHYGLFIFDSACDTGKQSMNKNWAKKWAYAVPHSALYFLCTFSGFLALFLTYLLASKIDDWLNISGGTGAIFVALALFTVSGISGALPRMLYLGQRPA